MPSRKRCVNGHVGGNNSRGDRGLVLPSNIIKHHQTSSNHQTSSSSSSSSSNIKHHPHPTSSNIIAKKKQLFLLHQHFRPPPVQSEVEAQYLGFLLKISAPNFGSKCGGCSGGKVTSTTNQPTRPTYQNVG